MIKLANYKIIKKIGSGGMGDVYLGEHTVLENKVAIKSLHAPLVKDEDFRKRFRKEAKTQWKLSHPNIVKLIDFQEQKDGLFLIMEYVEGKQLNDYISKDSGPIPEDKLIPLFIQILSAIKYAHNKGLVHRDIKPANVLITPSGDAKVLDFGIAKQSAEDSGLTKTGVQVGTVSYMSPEQVRAEKVDKLSDIYSLGVTLFQMAVGKAPYAGQTNQFNIQLDIVSNPFPKARSHYPSVSDKIEAIIEKATQKKKSDRFQSCEDFIKSLETSSKVVKQTLAVNKESKTEKKEIFKSKTEKKTLEEKDRTEKLKVDKKIEEKSGNRNKYLIYGLLLIMVTVSIIYIYQKQGTDIRKYQEKVEKEKTERLDRQARDKEIKRLEDGRLERERKDKLAKQASVKKEREEKKSKENKALSEAKKLLKEITDILGKHKGFENSKEYKALREDEKFLKKDNKKKPNERVKKAAQNLKDFIGLISSKENKSKQESKEINNELESKNKNASVIKQNYLDKGYVENKFKWDIKCEPKEMMLENKESLYRYNEEDIAINDLFKREESNKRKYINEGYKIVSEDSVGNLEEKENENLKIVYKNSNPENKGLIDSQLDRLKKCSEGKYGKIIYYIKSSIKK